MGLLEEFISGIWGGSVSPPSSWAQWLHRNLSDNHCPVCLKLDGCLFSREKAPPCPHHPYCHCVLKDISYAEVTDKAMAISDYSKYDPYLFNTEGKYPHNKEKLFHEWGYTVADARWLQKEIQKQGLQKYIDGDYELGKLDTNGQRISIRVTIQRKNSNDTVSFMTGWMVYANGRIKLSTPYGGK